MRENNHEIAVKLRRIASLLKDQQANPFRINAYRHAADTLDALPTDVSRILDEKGIKGLVALPAIGEGIARSIYEYVATGRISRLENLQGSNHPEAWLGRIPTLGPALAAKIHDELHVDSLETLEQVLNDGRLDRLDGLGRRLGAVVIVDHGGAAAVPAAPVPARPARGPGDVPAGAVERPVQPAPVVPAQAPVGREAALEPCDAALLAAQAARLSRGQLAGGEPLGDPLALLRKQKMRLVPERFFYNRFPAGPVEKGGLFTAQYKLIPAGARVFRQRLEFASLGDKTFTVGLRKCRPCTCSRKMRRPIWTPPCALSPAPPVARESKPRG